MLCRLSPYSFDVSPSVSDTPHVTHDSVPLGAIPIMASCTPEYMEAISKSVQAANATYYEYVRSEEGRGFNGQVVIIGKKTCTVVYTECRGGCH